MSRSVRARIINENTLLSNPSRGPRISSISSQKTSKPCSSSLAPLLWNRIVPGNIRNESQALHGVYAHKRTRVVQGRALLVFVVQSPGCYIQNHSFRLNLAREHLFYTVLLPCMAALGLLTTGRFGSSSLISCSRDQIRPIK